MISRRGFLGTVGTALTTHSLLKAGTGTALTQGKHNVRFKPGKRDIQTINTARNLIIVLMEGGPSHVDTFDLKAGSWTPDALGAATISGIQWPEGTMPNMAQRMDQMALVRGLSAETPLHFRGIFQMVTGHRQTNANALTTPHLGSVLSALNAQEGETLLPYGVSFSYFSPGNGRLALKHKLGAMNTDYGFPNLVHPRDGAVERFQLLDTTGVSDNDPRSHFKNSQAQAREMARDERLLALADFSELPDMGDDYRADYYQRQALLAVKTLALDVGTRMVELNFGGWDHHGDIYENLYPGEGIISTSRAFDHGFGYLLDLLEAQPGVAPGKSLLEETLVVAVGEFGRTPGEVDSNAGRDHYPAVCPAVMAGGGVQGGRVLGASDDNGAFVSDPGWNRGRLMRPGDLVATMFSALGVDFGGKVVAPNGQELSIMPEDENFDHISELFEGA